ncbi:MAG TPA: PQQ-binding-like beta-propeller repeat protein [Gemmataceae bacterium]|nr:PQQ-binding-like beta-propeller repeat protein [Gemmataceae bacterium]
MITTRTTAFMAMLLLTGALQAQDWPQWRGPARDNKVTGFNEPKTWPKELTKKWTISVGVGEASPVLVGDKLYTFGRKGNDEVTACYDAATGKEIWSEKYAAVVVTGGAKNYPGPRSTPAVADGKICTLGVGGDLICRDYVTGKELWKVNKGKPQFYTSTSPLIADGKCIVLAGTLAAYDLATGKPAWMASSIKAGYGSPEIMTVDSVKQIVTPADGVLAGVSFADGKVLWKLGIGGTWQNNYSTPIIDGNMVYYSITPGGKKGGKGTAGGSASGFVALKVEKKDGDFTATQVWKASPAAGYHTPVLRDGLIFGVSQQGRNFFCLDAKTGDKKWNDDTDHGECGSILNVGSVMVALTSDKDLIVFRPGAKEFSQVARYRVSSSPTWCVPILTGNRIYVKDKAGSLTLWTVD